MKLSSFEKDGILDQKVVQKLQQRGWQIKLLNAQPL